MNLLKRLQLQALLPSLKTAVAVLPATFIGISIWKQIDGIGTNGIGAAFDCHRDHNLDRSLVSKDQTQKFYFYIVPDQNPGINFVFP